MKQVLYNKLEIDRCKGLDPYACENEKSYYFKGCFWNSLYSICEKKNK